MEEAIVKIDPRILKDHPRNAEFYDDIPDEELERMAESIREHGIIAPLRVTTDMTIISGHQRKHAAIMAGLTTVPVIIDKAEDQDEITAKLIAANFGRMKNNPIKQAKWIKEYQRLRGVRQGSAYRKPEGNNSPQVTRDDIAKELGIDPSTIKNYLNLLKLIPELQEMTDKGRLTPTAGYKILVKLTPEEQREVLEQLPTDTKLKTKDVQAHVDKIRAKAEMEAGREASERIADLERQLDEAQNGVPIPFEEQEKARRLADDAREFREKWQQTKGVVDRLMEEKAQLEQQLKVEKAKNQGDGATNLLEQQIAQKNKEIIDATERASDLQTRIENAERKIDELNQQLRDRDERLNIAEHARDLEYKKQRAEQITNGLCDKLNSLIHGQADYCKEIHGIVEFVPSGVFDRLSQLIDEAEQALDHLGSHVGHIIDRCPRHEED